ncbi:helix-turn-helix domain-containing protein [Enterobacter sp. 22452]|uniref:helix-turn-helix domain-containing protein n=1 Tax=Enterobacter TaxID=547 RepID=UPI003F87CEE2
MSQSDENRPAYTKPGSAYAAILINRLSEYVEFKTYPKGSRFTINATQISTAYLIRQGTVSLSRFPDDIMLGMLTAPSIRGTIPMPDDSKAWCILKVLEPSEIAKINTEKFYALLGELQLWEVYARHLQLTATALTEHLFKLISPTLYNVVRLQLLELMAEPPGIRESMTAELYIRSKTRISRASVMRILAELKSSGSIVIKNGILKEILHLPE